MSTEPCRHESAVIEAAQSEEWSESLRAHARVCTECAESVRVAVWMGSVARRLGRNRPAPDPTYIWLKAEIERRAEDAAGVSRRGLSALVLLGLTLGIAGAAAVLAIWPGVSATANATRAWLSTALAEASLVDMTLIGTVWLGLPLMLVATYLLVLRPLR